MKKLQVLKYILFLAVLLTSYSCGGQFGGSNNYAGGGIGGTGITGVSVGKITAVDTSGISVNGVKFSLSRANITVNGAAADKTNLKLGMIVKVNGKFNTGGTTGEAQTVDFENNLEGPIDIGSIDSTAKTFKVLGKTIFVDTATTFESSDNTPFSFDKLTDKNVVEVSGFEAGDGSIHATYIELKEVTFQPGTTQVEIKGTISDFSFDNKTFKLNNNITVDFSSLDIPAGTLKNGLYVEVKSTSSVDNNGVLVSTKIEIKDTTPAYNEGEQLEMEGIITGFDASSPNDFKVNNQAVHVDPLHTTIEPTGGTLANDKKIEVKGTMHSSILDADKISIEPDEHKDTNSTNAEESKGVKLNTETFNQETPQVEIKDTSGIDNNTTVAPENIVAEETKPLNIEGDKIEDGNNGDKIADKEK